MQIEAQTGRLQRTNLGETVMKEFSIVWYNLILQHCHKRIECFVVLVGVSLIQCLHHAIKRFVIRFNYGLSVEFYVSLVT